MPFGEHVISFFEHHLATGHEPLIIDGSIYVRDDPERGIVWEERSDGSKRLVRVQESDGEWMQRMMLEDAEELAVNPLAEG